MTIKLLMSVSEALRIFDLQNIKDIALLTKEDIIKQFRKLVLKHHPDKGGDANLFNKIVKARQVLIKNLGLKIDEFIKYDKSNVQHFNIQDVLDLEQITMKNIMRDFMHYTPKKKGKEK